MNPFLETWQAVPRVNDTSSRPNLRAMAVRVHYCTVVVCKVYNYVLSLSGIHYARKSLFKQVKSIKKSSNTASPTCRCQGT